MVLTNKNHEKDLPTYELKKLGVETSRYKTSSSTRTPTCLVTVPGLLGPRNTIVGVVSVITRTTTTVEMSPLSLHATPLEVRDVC